MLLTYFLIRTPFGCMFVFFLFQILRYRTTFLMWVRIWPDFISNMMCLSGLPSRIICVDSCCWPCCVTVKCLHPEYFICSRNRSGVYLRGCIIIYHFKMWCTCSQLMYHNSRWSVFVNYFIFNSLFALWNSSFDFEGRGFRYFTGLIINWKKASFLFLFSLLILCCHGSRLWQIHFCIIEVSITSLACTCTH